MLNACYLKPATRRKISILGFIFSFTIPAFSQQRLNPVIGKNESEISLLYFSGGDGIAMDIVGSFEVGIQAVHRWLWKRQTKIGIGGLAAVQTVDPIHESDVVVYGALFGDIIQFIGKRQKWSVEGQIGHGIYKREHKAEFSSYEYAIK